MGILNRKNKGERKRGSIGLGLADTYKTPRPAAEQDAPEQERLTRPDEEAGVAVHEMKKPPQAEG